MRISKTNIFLFLLFVIIAIEGSGIVNGRIVSYFLILFLPIFLFILDREKVEIPKKPAILATIFLSVALVSVFFSFDPGRSLEHVLFLTSSFLVFFYSYLHREEIAPKIPTLIFALSLLFSALSLIIQFIPGAINFSSFERTGYQFTKSLTESHNHLGDFLVLPILISVFLLISQKKRFFASISILLFLPLLFFSYSRSAYISLFVTLIAIFIGKNFLKTKKHIFLFILLISLIFITFIFAFFATVNSSKHAPITQKINRTLVEDAGLSVNKSFLSERPEYARQAVSAILQYPLLGVGLDNFIFASSLFVTNHRYQITDTSHNLFLDIFAETGIFAGFIFFIFIFSILAYSKRSILFYLALAMLLNFQTDYTFKINSFMLLFFVILGTLVRPQKNISNNALYGRLALICTVFGALILLSRISFYNGYTSAAVAFYPLNKSAYPIYIHEKVKRGDENGALHATDWYLFAFSKDDNVLKFGGDIYRRFGYDEEAYTLYLQSFDKNSLRHPELIKTIYYYKLRFEGRNEAVHFIYQNFKGVEKLKNPWNAASFIQGLYSACTEIQIKCPVFKD